MKYEYVVTAGEGTLIRHGVAEGWSPVDANDMRFIAFDAINVGHAIQAEPCTDDCVTGE